MTRNREHAGHTYEDMMSSPDLDYEFLQERERDDMAHAAKCNRCGSTDVRWRQQSGRWVLFSSTPGREHVCEINASGYGAVPEDD